NDDAGLHLPVAVADRQVPGLLVCRDDIRAQVVAGRYEPSQLRRSMAAEVGSGEECRVLPGGLAENGGVEPADAGQPLGGIEGTLVEDDLRATRPGAEERVP